MTRTSLGIAAALAAGAALFAAPQSANAQVGISVGFGSGGYYDRVGYGVSYGYNPYYSGVGYYGHGGYHDGYYDRPYRSTRVVTTYPSYGYDGGYVPVAAPTYYYAQPRTVVRRVVSTPTYYAPRREVRRVVTTAPRRTVTRRVVTSAPSRVVTRRVYY